MKVRVLGFVFLVACAAFGQSITATKAYVDRKYAEATNAVPSIVTNVVATGEYTAWRFRCDVPAIQAALDASPPTVEYDEAGGGYTVYGFAPVDGYLFNEGFPGFPVSDCKVEFPSSCYKGDEWYLITAVRERITRNALGLARMKDLEKLPTHEMVTNVARSVVNSVWDASLGVTWEARMHNGHLYYIAVTNKPPEVK